MRVYSAPWVLPGRPDEPGAPALALADGAVALDGDRVVALGPRESLERRHGTAERLDAVLLPALVNAHLHLELSHLRGQVPGGDGLPTWIRGFLAARQEAYRLEIGPQPAPRAGPGAAPAQGRAEAAMAAGAAELRRAGVAAVGDVSNTLGSLAALSRAGLCGTVFHEIAGFGPERFGRVLAAARAERALLGASPPGLRVRESPHAVYSLHREALEALLRAGPGSIHLAEDPAERLLCRDGAGPFRTMLDALLPGVDELRVRARSPAAAVAPLVGPRHLLVHCVDLDDEDLALLAAAGATVVLCPRSNLHILGSGPGPGSLPRLQDLLRAGVPLAVGTDSLASAPSLAPLADLAVLRRAHPSLPAARLLPLAWNGAAVGAPHVGRLAPGPAPGVLAAPLEGARPADPFEFLLGPFAAAERPFTWLARNALEAA